MIAKVVFPDPPADEFDYKIPEGMKILKGQRVIVPFGRTRRIGYVVSVGSEYECKFKIKEIEKLLDEKPLIDDVTFEFARALADYYFVGIGEILNLIIPSRYKFSTPLPAVSVVAKASSSPALFAACFDFTERFKFYKEKISTIVGQKKSVLLILPCFSDIKWAQKFFSDFNPIVWHSDSTIKKQQELFKKILSVESGLVISSRRGVFLPINNLDTIIIEREYDYAHKDGQSPYYHCREVAITKSKFFSVNVIFGGLVFSTQIYKMLKDKIIQMLNTSLPSVYQKNPYKLIARTNFKSSDFFAELWDEFDKVYAQRKAAVIHYPKRGLSSGFYCAGCKKILKCSDCEVAITLFKSNGKDKLKCNYCGKEFSCPPVCPVCNSVNVYPLDFGTQKLEEIFQKQYPSAALVRYDRDSKKTISDKIDADFIIATSSPSKYKITNDVVLVVVLNADFDLLHPEYSSNEKIFLKLADYYDLLSSNSAEMLVETAFKNYYVFNASYSKFYEEELSSRKKLNYPPFSRLVELSFYGAKEAKVEAYVSEIVNLLHKTQPVQKSEIEILGPSKSREKKMTKEKILLKGVGDFGQLISVVKLHKSSSVKVKIDASV